MKPSLVADAVDGARAGRRQGRSRATAEVISKSVVPRSLQVQPKKLPDASLESAWSALAVLASGWSKQSPRLTVDFAEEPLRIDLHVGGLRMLAGQWTMETRLRRPSRSAHRRSGRSSVGKATRSAIFSSSASSWPRACSSNGNGARQARPGALDRRHVVGEGPIGPQTTARTSLPLGRRVAWLPELETRDGVLVHGKQRTAVVPLGLHEWRSDPRGGTLSSDNGRLTLAEATSGRSLYCGLLLDLDPARSKKCRTWRQLTVYGNAASRAPRRGGRIPRPVGRRPMARLSVARPAGNRAVLGQNISCEFYAGRFNDEGLVAEWIEIEAESGCHVDCR